MRRTFWNITYGEFNKLVEYVKSTKEIKQQLIKECDLVVDRIDNLYHSEIAAERSVGYRDGLRSRCWESKYF